MARIRSIKPDFWRDEKICSLKNKLAAALFIGLWNISDDEGKFKLSAKSISLELPFFRTQDIKIYLRELSACGLITISVCSEWARVVNWNHQKIDKPHLPKVKSEDIQWLTVSDSTTIRRPFDDHSLPDRIGKDRIGKDKRVNKTQDNSSKLLNREIWDAYKTGYQKRYKVEPVRNASVNAKISQLAKRLGADAVGVILFYTEHNNQFYSKHMHAIGLCLKDAEALHTQWKTGRSFEPTSQFARKKIDYDEVAALIVSRGGSIE